MKKVAIVAACRTAIGGFAGTLKDKPAHELGAIVIKEALSRAKVDAADVDDVIMGQILTTACGQNPARQASLAAGIPNETPAMTINHVCGSGLRSVALAMNSIMVGESEIVVAGGQENMSASPHAMFLRDGVKMGNGKMVDTMIHDGLWDIFNNYHMGITAENVAIKYGLTREELDEFAFNSQDKANKAQKNGAFDAEIVGVEIPQCKADSVMFAKDEHPRLSPLEKMASLRPAFTKEGVVTAANSSGINDGAAAVVLMSVEEAEKRGLTPLAVISSFASAGLDPSIMGIAPVEASNKVLEKSGWSVGDLDLVEANEAFAAQAVAVNNDMGWDTTKVNVNGGAIALGHPIGASGCRCLVTLLHAMQKRDAKKGLVTLCIGGGQGVAMTVER